MESKVRTSVDARSVAPPAEGTFPRDSSLLPGRGRRTRWSAGGIGDRLSAQEMITGCLFSRQGGALVLIVDGYNLSRSGRLLLSEDPVSPEGREELCALLSSYARGKGFRLTVVFDGRGGGITGRVRRPFQGGTAIFSSRTESADDAIRDLSRSSPAGTIVVTSDRGLAGTLSARTVTVVSCGEFADRLFAFQMEGIKGTSDGEEDPPVGPAKKGQGQKKKKRDRERDRILRKL